MKSDNHYELAFDAYLRGRGAAVVPVVEARRSYLDAEAVKSPDFIVLGPHDAKLVVDVKGRKFGAGPPGKPRRVWHNWCEKEDIVGLTRWTEHLGDGFRGVLAFVYHLAADVRLPATTPDLFPHRGELYLVRGIAVDDYRRRMRTRSPRWGTVHLAADDFRTFIKPMSHFFAPRVCHV